jgi:glycerate dehydrogenase
MGRSPEPRVVFLDADTFGDASLERFTQRWRCSIHGRTAPEEVTWRLRGHEVAVVNKVRLDAATLGSAQGLRLIAVAATGTDNVDIKAAQAASIRVSNVPGYATESVAQFTIALILELATRVGRYAERVREGAWEKSPIYTLFDFPVSELNGKILGIVGYGKIGCRVAEMARGLGMEVVVAARPGTAAPTGRRPLKDLLRVADIVSLHCPLTPETAGLIDGEALRSMKPTAFLVNTARGALVNEEALISALSDHRLAGAALDVISAEPPARGHALVAAARRLDNLLLTPHCAWTAREARERLLDETSENILAFLSGVSRNAVV